MIFELDQGRKVKEKTGELKIIASRENDQKNKPSFLRRKVARGLARVTNQHGFNNLDEALAL